LRDQRYWMRDAKRLGRRRGTCWAAGVAEGSAGMGSRDGTKYTAKGAAALPAGFLATPFAVAVDSGFLALATLVWFLEVASPASSFFLVFPAGADLPGLAVGTSSPSLSASSACGCRRPWAWDWVSPVLRRSRARRGSTGARAAGARGLQKHGGEPLTRGG
jgi:hypothetical protein